MTDAADALARALTGVVDRLNDSVPGPHAHPESGELLRIALAIEQAAEAADREAAGYTGASVRRYGTSAAADLDVEALAAALLAYGDGRHRLVLPLARRHEIAKALAAAYAAALRGEA